MKKMIIACSMLENELTRAMEETGCQTPICWVERGLHDAPAKLRQELQTLVDQYGPDYDALLLCYGFCGGALDGIVSPHAQLVLPAFHDCIQMLLCRPDGADAKAIDALYFTESWTQSPRFIGNEYADYCARCGGEKAQRAYRLMLQEYHSMTLVDTGCYDLARTARFVAPAAEALGLDCDVVPGSIHILKALLAEHWDYRFYCAPPGEPLTLTRFLEQAETREKMTNREENEHEPICGAGSVLR